jgi:predicted SprT family Zn-dependent metalloprotease
MIELMKKYVEEAKVILATHNMELPKDLILNVNNRLKKSLGRAKYRTSLGETFYTIEINGNAFTKDSAEFRETMLHEIAHVMGHFVYGTLDHDKYWAKFMRTFGLEANVFASKEKVASIGYQLPDTKKKTRTVCECSNCGGRFSIANKKALELYRFKCRCGGKIFSKGIYITPYDDPRDF